MNRYIAADSKHNRHLSGEFLSCHIGYSTDLKIRENSASGGLITQLLCHLLEKKEIDGAVVTKIKIVNGDVHLNSFIARTTKEIKDAAGSHYLKADFSKVINDILKEEGKFAIVATPCIIRRLRHMQNKTPELRNKICYLFGLFCGMPFNDNIFTYIYSKTKKNKEYIKGIKFRIGWPNFDMLINNNYRFSSDKWIFLHDIGVYVNESCTNCEDALAEYADLSFGDAWIKEIVLKDNIGTSICICRTARGNALLNAASEDNKIYIKGIYIDKIIESQRHLLYFKKLQKKYILITIPTRFIKRTLNKFSNRYPDNFAKIPILFYKIIFYFVTIYLVIVWKIDKR